jgi:hypothetical protein
MEEKGSSVGEGGSAGGRVAIAAVPVASDGPRGEHGI